jgi:hypothetical protein
MNVRLTIAMSAAVALGLVAVSSGDVASQTAKPLDYEVFKSRVEPIFLKKREGHTRCYVCHSEGNNSFRLERLSPGQKTYNEAQTRKNFETVSTLVVQGDVEGSKLLRHPLAPEAGGDIFHSGGRQFASKNDHDWQILAQWAGVAAPGRKK